MLRTACCEEHDVAPGLVASMDELEALALDPEQAPTLLSGWRGGVFGDVAQALCEGRVALQVKGGRVISVPGENAAS